MKSKNKVMIFIALSILGIVLIIGGIITNFTMDKTEKKTKEKDKVILSSTNNTNELLTFVEEGVNEELIGMYAFVEEDNYDNNDIVISALKEDGSVIKLGKISIGTHPFYSYYDQKLYVYGINSDELYYIDLAKGNGNYQLVKETKNVDKKLIDERTMYGNNDKYFFEEDYNDCIKINNNDYVCEGYSNNNNGYSDATILKYYLEANIAGEESWILKDEDKSFEIIGILSNNKLLVEINNIYANNFDLEIVDLSTGEILEDEKLDIKNKRMISLYYIN